LVINFKPEIEDLSSIFICGRNALESREESAGGAAAAARRHQASNLTPGCRLGPDYQLQTHESELNLSAAG